jgi:hypothetical protein
MITNHLRKKNTTLTLFFRHQHQMIYYYIQDITRQDILFHSNTKVLLST